MNFKLNILQSPTKYWVSYVLYHKFVDVLNKLSYGDTLAHRAIDRSYYYNENTLEWGENSHGICWGYAPKAVREYLYENISELLGYRNYVVSKFSEIVANIRYDFCKSGIVLENISIPNNEALKKYIKNKSKIFGADVLFGGDHGETVYKQDEKYNVHQTTSHILALSEEKYGQYRKYEFKIGDLGWANGYIPDTFNEVYDKINDW